jgi:hypothetical protein
MVLFMLLILICIGIACWALYMGIKFYLRMDWDEPVESSPDFAEMHKRQAELLHVQDVLQEAHDQNKVSAALLAEFNIFLDKEFAEMKAVEDDWKAKRRSAKAVR